ncbi:MAG: ABC transporter permease [Velocimicrobium sp.]
MRKLSEKQLALAILTIAGALCIGFISLIGHSLPSQQGAKRFSGDGKRYAQISAFVTKGTTVLETNINNYRSSIQKALEEASIESKSINGRLWVDCYSGKTNTNVVNGKITEKVNMIGVGGDFFLFHPITMISGYYFSSDAVMKDRILIDKEAAWQLFGSIDVVGLNLQVGNKTCVVAGVFELSDDKLTNLAAGKTPIIIVPFELFTGISSTDALIDCYEMILPNPVSGFAKQMALKSVDGVDLSSVTSSEIDLDELDIEIVENTNRFSLIRLIETMRKFRTRSMMRKPMEYPFWENVARATEDRAVILLLSTIILLLLPISFSCKWAWKRYKQRKWTIKNLNERIQEKVEEKKKKKWEEKKHEKEKSIK